MKKIRPFLPYILGALPLIIPFVALAAGLVPCGVSSDPGIATGCRACDLVQLIQNVLTFIITLSIPIAAGLFAYGGFKYMSSGLKPSARGEANKIFTSTIIGFVVMLSGWLIVNTVLYILVGQQFNGSSWFTIQCVPQSQRNTTESLSNALNQLIVPPSQSGGFSGTPTVGQATLQGAAQATQQYSSQLCTIAGSNCQIEQAIMMSENSSGNPNTVTTATQQDGSTQQCVGLMQVCVNTARSIDSANATLSNSAIVAKLQDPSYNMTLGNQIYSQCGSSFSGANAIACYNGGPGANAPSNDCGPSVTKWACTQNPGNYVQTQTYVPNVEAAQLYLQQHTPSS